MKCKGITRIFIILRQVIKIARKVCAKFLASMEKIPMPKLELLQLKSLINRSNVHPTVKKDVNAVMDFLQVGKKVDGYQSLI